MFALFYRSYTIFIAMKRWDLKTALVALPSKILLNWAYFYLFGKKFTLSEFFSINTCSVPKKGDLKRILVAP